MAGAWVTPERVERQLQVETPVDMPALTNKKFSGRLCDFPGSHFEKELSEEERSRQDLPAAEGVEAGRAILSMLRVQEPPRQTSQRSDPQPLSTDEYQLWAMEAREDAELGADLSNQETFGEEACYSGWSFEENLAANERLCEQQRWVLKRFKESLTEIVKYVKVEPECLKNALTYVVSRGWESIAWKGDYTALHLAAEFSAIDVMPLLVALGAEVDKLDSKGRSARDISKEKGDGDCYQLLRELRKYQPARCQTKARGSEAPSSSSTEPEPEQDPGHMRKKRPSDPASREDLQELMQTVARFRYALTQMVNLLQLPPVGSHAVMQIVTTGNSMLCSEGWYFSVLHAAVNCGRDDIIPLLVKLGADLDAKDSDGMTAHELATTSRIWSCAWKLSQLKSDGLHEDSKASVDTNNPLHGYYEKVKLRQKQQATPSYID